MLFSGFSSPLTYNNLYVWFADYAVEHTSDAYCDVTLSDGAESVMNKWIPPTAVNASS